MTATSDERIFCKTLANAFAALMYPSRVLLMKRMLESGPITVSEAVEFVGTQTQQPSRKITLKDLRALCDAGLAREITEVVDDGAGGRILHQTWRAAQSCVANAVRRALIPIGRVFRDGTMSNEETYADIAGV